MKISAPPQLHFLRKLSLLPKPLSYDRHVYYIEASNFTGRKEERRQFPQMMKKGPTWFSLVRDPVDKYISRFSYLRPRKFKERMDSNLNRLPEDTNYTEFKTKNFDTCIMTGDVECTFFLGRKYDLTIVSKYSTVILSQGTIGIQ